MKVKTDFENCDWITAGKIYDASPDQEFPGGFTMVDDDGEELYCSINNCAHLKCNDWQVVEND